MASFRRAIRHWNLYRITVFLLLVFLFLIIFGCGTMEIVKTTQSQPFVHYTDSSSLLYNTSYPGVEKYTRFVVNRLGLLPLTDEEPLVPAFGPVINDVLSFRYGISIRPCRKFLDDRSPTVFIAIMSATGNFQKRISIRRTWKTLLIAAEQKGRVGIAGFSFIVGLPQNNATQSQIEEENKTHGDIIQIEMTDVYRNLPHKGAAMLNWLYANCLEVDFVFKVDDDIYVNVHNLVDLVHQMRYRSYDSVFGVGNFGFKPVRDETPTSDDAKWAMTFEEYPWNTYPDYTGGLAYFLHGSTILPLLAACQTTPMFPFEDVYLTGMCREKADIKMQYSIGTSSISHELSYSFPIACEIRQYLAWPCDNLLLSHAAVQNFYYFNKTRCKTLNFDGNYSVVDAHEPIHFHFSQRRTPLP